MRARPLVVFDRLDDGVDAVDPLYSYEDEIGGTVPTFSQFDVNNMV